MQFSMTIEGQYAYYIDRHIFYVLTLDDLKPFVNRLFRYESICAEAIQNGHPMNRLRRRIFPMNRVKTGLENLIEASQTSLEKKRLGLLCNPASVNFKLRHARDLLHERFPGQLKALFAPQHGFFAEKQDNMIESDHLKDPKLGVPIFSLYGETRIPTQEMLAPIDILLVDLVDVGTRVYTFFHTLSYCLEAAKKYGKKIIILDRPNPVNGLSIEGNLLDPGFSSFVGRYPIPMRHGLTLGELALFINHRFNINCDLAVIEISGWRREIYFEETGLPWVAPSPNLPTPCSAMVYPGQVIFEGTNLSEGRGTTQPFELFGAPYLDTDEILRIIGGPDALPGLFLRPVIFEPTANKWKGKACRGFQLHVTDRNRYNSYESSLSLLQAVIATSGDAFQWKKPPYEYEYEKMPIDLIIGSRDIRVRIENLEPMESISSSFKPGVKHFREETQPFLLYDDTRHKGDHRDGD